MINRSGIFFWTLVGCFIFMGCNESMRGTGESDSRAQQESGGKQAQDTTISTAVGEVNLPAPDTTKSNEKHSEVIGWQDEQKPTAPEGFTVVRFAEGLEHPRWIYVAPNQDVFVAESDKEEKSANRITLFRDTNKDGKPDLKVTFLEDLNQPLGMLVLDNYFYVANSDALMRFPYQKGQTKIEGKGEKILDLPAGGYNNHWTRNIISNADGSKIYISVGSASNVGEYGMDEENRRANILEINPDGSGEKIYASGLRNPVGMDWAPGTDVLWTSVNERDHLGDELVPDYLTSVQEDGFYGWPYAYFGANEDPRMRGKRPDLVAKTLIPEVPLGSHTASLGLAFYKGEKFPEKYQKGAFIGQHGSWNRSEFSGYKVVFVPFNNGKPTAKPEDFLTGFIADGSSSQVYGRPVGVAVLSDGAMLVADDAGNIIWRVSANNE